MSKISKFNKNSQKIGLTDEEKARVAEAKKAIHEKPIWECLAELTGRVFVKPMQKRRK